MPSFGEKLREERESRTTSLEEIARASGVGIGYLQALENDAFDALPGRSFGKLYLRAYAEILGFDPQPLLDDYDRAQSARQPAPTEAPVAPSVAPRPVASALARWRESRIVTPIDPPPASPEPEPAPIEPAESGSSVPDEPIEEAPQRAAERESPRRARPFAAIFVGLAIVLAVATYFGVLRDGGDEPGPAPPVPSSPEPPPPRGAKPPLPPPRIEPVPAPAPEPATGASSVPEHGVGRRIVARRLAEVDDTFVEGEVVWFSTRVLGGRRGERIRHVWRREGRAVQSIELTLGGSDWRTHSSKTLYGVGTWSVEARDEAGRSLAEATFTCRRAGR